MDYKIYCIFGKSGSGKDTLMRNVMKWGENDPIKIVPSTTRPIRTGETDGIDCHFVTKEQLDRLEVDGQIIEKRSYNTVHGVWYYFTQNFEIEEGRKYITISTLDGIRSFIRYFGKEHIVPVYLNLNDIDRFNRCYVREMQQSEPKIQEMLRRWKNDSVDFSHENLQSVPNLVIIDADQPEASVLSDMVEVMNR